jgi:hypothetical protein
MAQLDSRFDHAPIWKTTGRPVGRPSVRVLDRWLIVGQIVGSQQTAVEVIRVTLGRGIAADWDVLPFRIALLHLLLGSYLLVYDRICLCTSSARTGTAASGGMAVVAIISAVIRRIISFRMGLSFWLS